MFNYAKEGPGVAKDAPKKRTFFAFMEIYGRKFWKLAIAGLLWALTTLPIVTRGWADAGLTFITRNFSREKHAFIKEDFIDSIKKNRKNALIIGIINNTVTGIFIFNLIFTLRHVFPGVMLLFGWTPEQVKALGELDTMGMILMALSLIGYVTFTWMKYYIPFLMITFKLSIKQVYKNAFLFAAVNLKANLIISLVLLLVYGGLISLAKSLPLIVTTFGGAMKSMSGAGAAGTSRTEKDLNLKLVIASVAVLTLVVWLIPAIPVSLLGALVIVVFGFFFATVSSRMVGLVGSSNNPVSGMTIATLLIATMILKVTGANGIEGMASAIAIGGVICIICAIAGDTSQDLKTGYLLGATPKKQQIGELVGVVASALAIGGTLFLLDTAWGFGSKELGAPQASLMKLIVEGVMEGNLPWALVFTGAFIAIAVEILGIPVLPFAIGIYLPIHLNACIMIGGLIRLALDKMKKDKEEKEAIVNDGILFCSGMIAGEGLVGILLALFAVFGIDKAIDISAKIPGNVATIGGLVLLGVMILTVLKFSLWRKRTPKTNEK